MKIQGNYDGITITMHDGTTITMRNLDDSNYISSSQKRADNLYRKQIIKDLRTYQFICSLLRTKEGSDYDLAIQMITNYEDGLLKDNA